MMHALDFSSAEENLRHLEFVWRVDGRLLLFLMVLISFSQQTRIAMVQSNESGPVDLRMGPKSRVGVKGLQTSRR
jgi:hypothetical protein